MIDVVRPQRAQTAQQLVHFVADRAFDTLPRPCARQRSRDSVAKNPWPPCAGAGEPLERFPGHPQPRPTQGPWPLPYMNTCSSVSWFYYCFVYMICLGETYKLKPTPRSAAPQQSGRTVMLSSALPRRLPSGGRSLLFPGPRARRARGRPRRSPPHSSPSPRRWYAVC